MKHLKRLLSVLLAIALAFAVVANLYLYIPAVQTCLDQLFATVSEWITGTDVPDKGGLIQEEGDGSLIDDGDLDSLEDSGITGDSYSVDTEKYPYYSFLTESGQTIYRQVCANIEALETTFVPETDISVSEMKNAVEAVFNDHPEYFWIETAYAYRYTSNNTCVQISVSFNGTTEDFDSAKTAFDSAAGTIIDYAAALDSDYEKEKYVHDAVIALADYDESVDSSYSQSAYSALVMGRTVCAGYARAFQYILQELDVTTYYCVGYASGDHAWNIVELSDGYYNVDLTWDDSVSVSYAYFNLPDSVFSRTHTRTDLSVQLPACTATGYYNLEGNSTTQTPDNHAISDDNTPTQTPDSETAPSDDNTPAQTPGNETTPESEPATPSQPDGGDAPQAPSENRTDSPGGGGAGQNGGAPGQGGGPGF